MIKEKKLLKEIHDEGARRAAELLEEQILIKDLTGKIANGRQYVRIAVRSRRENEQLAEALKIKIGIAAEYEKY